MHQGNWSCSMCQGAIKELPFEPKNTNNLTCRACYASSRNSAGNSGSVGGGKKMFEGNWQCSNCGNAINKLSFEPRNTSNLRCLDCFKASKGGA